MINEEGDDLILLYMYYPSYELRQARPQRCLCHHPVDLLGGVESIPKNVLVRVLTR